MIRVSLDSSRMQAALGGIDEALADLRPAWEGVRTIFLEMEKAHFDSEGNYAPDTVWVPLSPRYAAWKARAYPGKTILRRTDRMYSSLTEHGANTMDAIDERHEGYAEFGTRVPWAVYHDSPLARRSSLPRRIVIPEPTSAEGERMVDVILAYCLEVMRQRAQAAGQAGA